MNSDKDRFRRLAASFGLDAVGFAACPLSSELETRLRNAGEIPFVPSDVRMRSDVYALLPNAQSVAVFLFPYKPKIIRQGNIALYARAKDYHHIVHRYLKQITEAAASLYPQDLFIPLVDTSPLADRWLAYAAGLGFFGKNHCLIHDKYGSYFTIGSLLTTLSFPPDKPIPSRCGNCRQCLSACPGNALGERRMNVWRCKSWLTQKKEPLTAEEESIVGKTPLIFGCDECQRCCPFNDRSAPTPLSDMEECAVENLTEEDLLSCSNRGFQKRYGEYAFAWRGRSTLLRNLRIIRAQNNE